VLEDVGDVGEVDGAVVVGVAEADGEVEDGRRVELEDGVLGELLGLVVRIVGSWKNLATAPSASTLFLNSDGAWSWTREMSPAWWSTSRTTASSFEIRL